MTRIAALAVLVAALTLAAPVVPVWAAVGTQVLYVAPGGSDTSNTCAVASSPCSTVGHAVAEAAANDVIDVAPGRYLEHGVMQFAPP
jgi:hypothetical protein